MLGNPPQGTRALLAAWILLGACASPTVDADFQAADEGGPVDAAASLPSLSRPPMAWVPSQHFRRGNRTRRTIDAIAIHTTEGNYNSSQSFAQNHDRVYRGTINYFKKNDRSVSAHFVIGPRGEITQMVRETDIAHTTTYYNARSFGIECAGWAARQGTWTPELLDSLVELCAWLSVSWDIPVVHPTGTARKGPHRKRTSNPDRPQFTAPGIVGHNQVQPWNKTDPGKHFPWRSFMARVRQRVANLQPRPVASVGVPMVDWLGATDSGREQVMQVHDHRRLDARRRRAQHS